MINVRGGGEKSEDLRVCPQPDAMKLDRTDGQKKTRPEVSEAAQEGRHAQ
jgi:hypothetical protein